MDFIQLIQNGYVLMSNIYQYKPSIYTKYILNLKRGIKVMKIDCYVKSHPNKIYCFYLSHILIGFYTSNIEYFILKILNYINFNKTF